MNLVRICVELLNTLSVWLADTRCPHYFISNCNLLDISFSVGSMASKLRPMSSDEQHLSAWLVDNYIRRCAQLCPHYIELFFDHISTGTKLQKAVSEIVRWRVQIIPCELWDVFRYAECVIAGHVSGLSLTKESSSYWTTEMMKIDKRLAVFFSAVALLHVAYLTPRNGFNDNLMDIVSTVLGHNLIQCHGVLSRCKVELNTSKLIELLQKSAVEHLTTYRRLMAPYFGSVATIITTDFEAMCAYKRDDYQRCLQLSTQNVHMLLYARRMPDVHIFPGFVQLMDDDIVSVTALTRLVNAGCRHKPEYSCISQLTLSLYLMTQCQLKLHHSVTPLAQTLDYIKVAQRRLPRERTLDQLTLTLIKHSAYRTILTQVCDRFNAMIDRD